MTDKTPQIATTESRAMEPTLVKKSALPAATPSEAPAPLRNIASTENPTRFTPPELES